MNYFYDNIKHIRKSRKLSLQKMSEMIKVNPSTISRWENKEMGVTVDNAYEISKILNIPLPDLIGKDLRVEENVVLDDKHKLDKIVMEKSKELNDSDKEMLIGIIDSISKRS